MKLPWDKDASVNQLLTSLGIVTDLQYEVKKYPDGSQYVTVLGGDRLTFRINDYNDLWTLNQINDVLVSQKRTCSLCIPSLLDAQADRRFSPHQSSGLKLVCELLNSMKAFNQIHVYHPHNAEVVEALIDRVTIIDNYYFINEVLKKLANSTEKVENWGKDLSENLILMSSDAGGFKPLMKLTDKLGWQGETYSASKARKYEDGHSKLTQLVDREDFGGKDILIVDDLCIFGGTFKGLAKLLKEKNCGKIYLAVSHLTVQNLGDQAVTAYFDKVFTTNSKFDKYWDNTERSFSVRDNLEVIKLF